MKAYFLKFDSKYNCKLIKQKIKDGRVIIDDGMFIVDETKPLLLKAGMFGGVKPLYIIKWDAPFPHQPTTEEKPKKKKPNNPNSISVPAGHGIPIKNPELTSEIPEFDYKKYRPEMLKSLADMSVMKNLMGPKKSNVGSLVYLIGGLFIGAIVLFVLQYFNLVPAF